MYEEGSLAPAREARFWEVVLEMARTAGKVLVGIVRSSVLDVLEREAIVYYMTRTMVERSVLGSVGLVVLLNVEL